MDGKIAMSFKEASQATSLSHWTLRKYAAEGKLETVRVGRRRLIEPEALQKLISKGKR